MLLGYEDQIRKHCREEHGWENRQKGRPKAGTEKQFPWRSGVHCQHFFVRGPGAQFFEVQAAESSLVIHHQRYLPQQKRIHENHRSGSSQVPAHKNIDTVNTPRARFPADVGRYGAMGRTTTSGPWSRQYSI